MPRYVALSKSTHRHAGLVPAGLSHALGQAAVPVVAEELPHLMPTMALAFVPSSAQQGELELVALQSLQAGVNVYVHTNGRWIGGYQPAWYRAHPFKLLPDETSQRQVVCIDEEAAALELDASEGATRLFNDEGEPTQRLKDTITFLEKVGNAQTLTQRLVNQLHQAGVIVPWQVTARHPESEAGRQVPGLHHIDETALKALAPETLAELAQSGALTVAYSQLLSEHRLKGLERLYQLRNAAEHEAAKDDVDLDELFDGGDDDITFNFDS